MLRHIAVGAAVAAALVLVLPAGATAPPVGPLPKGPTTTIRAQAEANVGKTVVVVYRAVRPGRARLAYGLTRGETARAVASLAFDVTVTGR